MAPAHCWGIAAQEGGPTPITRPASTASRFFCAAGNQTNVPVVVTKAQRSRPPLPTAARHPGPPTPQSAVHFFGGTACGELRSDQEARRTLPRGGLFFSAVRGLPVVVELPEPPLRSVVRALLTKEHRLAATKKKATLKLAGKRRTSPRRKKAAKRE